MTEGITELGTTAVSRLFTYLKMQQCTDYTLATHSSQPLTLASPILL